MVAAVFWLAANLVSGASETVLVQGGAPGVVRRSLLSTAIDPEKTVARVEIQEVTLPPKTKAPLHLHPCPTTGVVTAGMIAFQIEGQPVRHLGPGDAFLEPAGVRIARFDNEGETPATFVVQYLLSKEETETVKVLSR